MGLSKVDIKVSLEMKQEGYTLQQRGGRFGVCRERVRQVEAGFSLPQRMIKRYQLGKLLGVSESFVAYRERKGILKPVRLGNAFYLYHLDDIEKIKEALVNRCKGGCGQVIPPNHTWCPTCLIEHRRQVQSDWHKKDYVRRKNNDKPF